MKEVEITCEVFENIEKIKKTLTDNDYEFVEEYTLNDVYMQNLKTGEYVPKNGIISDTYVIRYVEENDQKVIKKKRIYEDGIEIGTEVTKTKVKDVKLAEEELNAEGYRRYLNMIQKNYMYKNKDYTIYIQEIENIGKFLEVESKKEECTIEELKQVVKALNLKIGQKFDIRKAEFSLKYEKESNECEI